MAAVANKGEIVRDVVAIIDRRDKKSNALERKIKYSLYSNIQTLKNISKKN
jgi:orotate phosphoribosyltransferase